jgi:hypothetical protein
MNTPESIWGWLFWLVPNLITTYLWVCALKELAHARASAKIWRYAALGAIGYIAMNKFKSKEGGQL